MEDFRPQTLFSLQHTLARPILEDKENVWDALSQIGEFILKLQESLGDDYKETAPGVFVSVTAKIAPSASITGPCIIGHNTEVRHCAFIRGNALIGENCVIGNSTELKNVIIFDNVQVPHYNYVGDSILGYRSHMGAGSITSNVKSDKTLVCIKNGQDIIKTGRKKVGAFLGDFTEVGCGTVLCPGVVIGKNCSIYPLSMVRGVVEANSIYKNQGEVASKLEEN